MSENEVKIYSVLDELNISYDKHEHPPAYTVEDLYNMGSIADNHCKNIFVRNQNGKKHYLVVINKDKQVDLKQLKEDIGSTRLSFASEERLEKYLNVKPGAVTPLAIINDENNEVLLYLDKDLKNQKNISFHPGVNTVTITMLYDDFMKFLKSRNKSFEYVTI